MDPQASAASREIQETHVASCGAEMSFGSAGTGERYSSALWFKWQGHT